MVKASKSIGAVLEPGDNRAGTNFKGHQARRAATAAQRLPPRDTIRRHLLMTGCDERMQSTTGRNQKSTNSAVLLIIA